jgi:hypothetical protein
MKSENPLILCAIHHRQNPTVSTMRTMLGGSLFITALRVLKLRMEESTPQIWKIPANILFIINYLTAIGF